MRQPYLKQVFKEAIIKVINEKTHHMLQIDSRWDVIQQVVDNLSTSDKNHFWTDVAKLCYPRIIDNKQAFLYYNKNIKKHTSLTLEHKTKQDIIDNLMQLFVQDNTFKLSEVTDFFMKKYNNRYPRQLIMRFINNYGISNKMQIKM